MSTYTFHTRTNLGVGTSVSSVNVEADSVEEAVTEFESYGIDTEVTEITGPGGPWHYA